MVFVRFRPVDATNELEHRSAALTPQSVQGRREKRVHDLFHARCVGAGRRLDVIKQLDAPLVNRDQTPIEPLEHRGDQRFFRAEVVVDRREVDPRLRRDVPQRRGRKTTVRERPLSDVENSVLCGIVLGWSSTDSAACSVRPPPVTSCCVCGAASRDSCAGGVCVS